METKESEEEKIPKYDVIIKNGVRYFEPDNIRVYAATYRIFPVPQPNAVGTIDANRNGITFIEFTDTNFADARLIAKNFSRQIYDDNFKFRVSPNFSDDMIVYSKTRIAVIVNVKTGEAFHAGFGISSDDFMLGISFLDPQKNLFVVVTTKWASNYNDDINCSLHIARLDGKRLIDLGVVVHDCYEAGCLELYQAWNTWLVHDRILIAYDEFRSKNMLAFNGLTETSHPFTKIFNYNKTKIHSVKGFAIHPHLPFGVVVEFGLFSDDIDALPEEAQKIYWNTRITHPLHILRWDTDDPDEQFASFNHKLLPLMPLFKGVRKKMAFAYPSFSPDGKWLVLGCFKPNWFRNPHFIAIPIDPDNPEFLNIGELIVLGQIEDITSIAWSTNPTSLVVAVASMLYKWNLDELRNARIIVVPKRDSGGSQKTNNENKKPSIFKRIGSMFKGNK